MRGEWGPEVGRGDSKHPSLPLARAERKPLDQKKKHPPRHQRENQLKEKTSLPLPRAERKPFDQKKKPAPRHQRANLLKEELTLMQSKLPLRYSFTAKINF